MGCWFCEDKCIYGDWLGSRFDDREDKKGWIREEILEETDLEETDLTLGDIAYMNNYNKNIPMIAFNSSGGEYGDGYMPIKYCPVCGKKLTDLTWEEINKKRLIKANLF